MDAEMAGMGTGLRRRSVKPMKKGVRGNGDLEPVIWQKEVLWLVVMEGVVEKEDLIARLEEQGGEDLELVIEGMLGNGFFEEINGYLRIHPDFAENCYAVIR